MKQIFAVFAALAIISTAAYAVWRLYPSLVAGGEAAPAYQGYVEGEFIQVASPVAGRLEALHVRRGDSVQAGEALFDLEAEYEKAVLLAAEADNAAAEATLADMRTGKRQEEISALEAQLEQALAAERDSAAQLERIIELHREGAATKSQLDKSQADADANYARVQELRENILIARLPSRDMQVAAQAAAVGAAKARIVQAEWALDNKKIASPRNGRVYEIIQRQGELVPAGQPVLRLLPPENVKIRFYVPETVLASMHPGREVLVRLDGAPEVPAVVSYVSAEAEFTPPVIYSNDSRYKLTFMIEANPFPETATRLNPGQPVVVEPR